MINLANSWDMQQIKCSPKKGKKGHAAVGNTVRFSRNGINICGQVESYRENTVIVSISDEDAAKLHLESPLTLVNHKNYEVIPSDNLRTGTGGELRG